MKIKVITVLLTLAILSANVVLGCDKPICVDLHFSKDVVNIGHGIYHSMGAYVNSDPVSQALNYEVNQEPMRTSKSSNHPYHIPKCYSKDEWCFRNGAVKASTIEPGSYKQSYKVVVVPDSRDFGRFVTLGKFQNHDEALTFIKQSVMNVWYRLIHGRQFHGIKFTDGSGAKNCKHVVGWGSPYEKEQEICYEICTDIGCHKRCHMSKHKPHMHCTENTVFATVPKSLTIVFKTWNAASSSWDYLEIVHVQINNLTKVYPANPYHCSNPVKYALQTLQFLPKIGAIFGLGSLVCAATQETSPNNMQDVPDYMMFLPRDAQVGVNRNELSNIDPRFSSYECSKCWPSDWSTNNTTKNFPSTGENKNITNDDPLVVSFEATEEGKRDGNYCRFCFVLQEVLDDNVDFATTVNPGCRTLGKFSVPIIGLLKLLPVAEKRELQRAQDTCLRARDEDIAKRRDPGEKESKFGVAATAGVTFGASAVLFGCIGFVIYRNFLKQGIVQGNNTDDPVLESFKA